MLSKILFQNYFQKCFSKMLSKMFLEKVFKKNDSSKIHVLKKYFYRVKENGFQIVFKKKKVFFAFLKRAKFLQYFFSQNKCVLPRWSSKKKNKIKNVFFSSKYPNRIFSKNVNFQNNKVNFVTFFISNLFLRIVVRNCVQDSFL